jgi:hypothetical protein
MIKHIGLDLFTCFRFNAGLDLGEISFCGVGKTKGQCLADSFLPRSTSLVASNSRTRPAATSLNPLSISAFSAPNPYSWTTRRSFHLCKASHATSLLNV